MTPTPATPSRPTWAGRLANARQAYDLSLAGSIGAVVGLYLYVELVHAESVWVRDLWAGVAIGGAVGFFLGGSGPIRDGAWLRAAREATWGALGGAGGGAVGLILGEWALGGLQGGLIGRSASWAILGLGLGLGQGVAARSRQRLGYGLVGGAIGGSVGGFLFEAIRGRMGDRYDLGQGLGIALLGLGLGLALSLVEQVLRRAWVRVLNGRQEGRSYLLSGGRSSLGLDEHATVGLFGDPGIARAHASIVHDASGFVLHPLDPTRTTRVNGRAASGPTPLGDGDRIELGRTLLLFRKR